MISSQTMVDVLLMFPRTEFEDCIKGQ